MYTAGFIPPLWLCPGPDLLEETIHIRVVGLPMQQSAVEVRAFPTQKQPF